ncbi:MAG: DUF1957 domain-containing protein [Treponema sp.]|nr:DUF1957 domain-containing protein [Treponema sp.]
MGNKRLVFVLNATQEYIRHTGENAEKYASVSNYLFDAISETYLPLLKMLENLEKDNVSFKLSLVLTPVLCTLLEDKEIQSQYLAWLDKKVEFGQKEIQRTSGNPALQAICKNTFEKYQKDKELFESYNCRLVRKFYEFKKKGLVEFLATCGTDIFMPFYHDMEEVMSAQVESGILSFRNFFGDLPDGFWLPELGYYEGVEKIIKSYGINYTILDSRSFLFSKIEPKNGLFTPARFTNALVCYGRDYDSDTEIFGQNGYCRDYAYKNLARDVGFTLAPEALEPYIAKGTSRYSMGYSYWNKSPINEDEAGNANDSSNLYDAETAKKRLCEHAKLFLDSKVEKLNKAASLIPEEDVTVLVTIDANRLRENWNEGILWLEQVLRMAAAEEIETASPRSIVDNPFKLQRIVPYYGSCSSSGYAEELLSSKNNWMMRYARKASERMVDLAERFPAETGLKARLLNLGVKELMFAESSGWAKMMESEVFPEYAEMRFKQSINDFTAVFDALGSNTVSTEWLTKLESEHQIFPWMNYRIFCKKH